MSKLNVVLLISLMLTITACGSLFEQGAVNEIYSPADEAVTWNPQQYAGLTHVQVGYNDDGSIDTVSWWDGKEKTDVAVNVLKNPDGSVTLNYTATGVTAFEGQGMRANVETGVVEVGADVASVGGTVVRDIVQIISNKIAPIPALPETPE